MSIAGDPDRAVALLRYLAGEMACNSWSDDVEITIAGFPATETELLVALNPDRIRAVSSVPDAAARLRRRASAVTTALGQAGDALAGRVLTRAEARRARRYPSMISWSAIFAMSGLIDTSSDGCSGRPPGSAPGATRVQPGATTSPRTSLSAEERRCGAVPLPPRVKPG
jgi:hypothetical protein